MYVFLVRKNIFLPTNYQRSNWSEFMKKLAYGYLDYSRTVTSARETVDVSVASVHFCGGFL